MKFRNESFRSRITEQNDLFQSFATLIRMTDEDRALTEGAVTEGALTEGALTEGALTEGALTEGALTGGAPTGSGRRRAGPLSGRQAEAARNDRRILESARAVFTADPGAPITAVAKHAGVGISALYTRYGSKEELLRTLCTDGLVIVTDETQTAIDRVGSGRDHWQALADFARRLVDAD